jgi:hypothetical protein
LTWESNLEQSAESWSQVLALQNNCILYHKLTSFAQNLYAGYGWTSPNITDSIQAWINEKLLINEPNVSFEQIGHYLIIIHPSIKTVGCSYSINYIQNCFVVTCDYN